MEYGKYIELLRSLVRIPRVTGDEGAAADRMEAFLAGEGVACARVRNNVLARSRHFDPAKRTLALDAHLDTVAPAAGYTRDPFDPGEDPEKVWGLGANDDGGSVAAMTAAFCALWERDLPVNLMLVLTCEEERSGPNGAAYLYDEGGYFAAQAEFPYPDWVLVGEPTGMQAAVCERGLLVLDGEARGVSGHAAREEGVNALYLALDDIARLRAHRFARRSPLMGDVKLTVTQIEAGTAHNVVPDRCRFVVDIRPTEQYAPAEILAELQALCGSTLTPRNLSNRSSATPEASPLRAAARALGIGTYSSPTTSNWMRIRCDAMKMGPGESARSHRPDEYLLAAELRQAIPQYIAFIERLAYGNTME